MAEIPAGPGLDPVQGASAANVDQVRPTDFGLDQAAQSAAGVEGVYQRAQLDQIRVQAMRDSTAVEPDVRTFSGQIADQAAGDRAKWDGTTPGFAADQIAKANGVAAKMAANRSYTPGQRAEFTKLAQAHVTNFGNQMIDHEQGTLFQNAVDQQQVQVNGALGNFQQTFQPLRQQLLDSYDGSQKGLTASGLAAFDTAAQTAIAAAPAPLRPQVQLKLANMRTEEQAQLSTLEQKGADAYVLKNTTDQANGLINTISSNPLAYDSVVSNNLPALVAAMPAGLDKKATLVDLTGEAAAARIRGLIAQGHAPQAAGELQSGRYDAFLQPAAKEQLASEAMAAARSDAPVSVDQGLAQQDVLRRAGAETTALLDTGKSSGQVSEAEVRSSLSIDEATKVLTGWRQARDAFTAVGSVRALPMDQLTAMATASPDPDGGDYQTQLLQRQAAQTELASRTSDPGAWAFASNGKGPPPKGSSAAVGLAQDRGAALQALAQAWQTGAAHAGGQFAGSMIESQRLAGIPRAAWAVLPTAEAHTLAASVTGAAPDQKPAAMAHLSALITALPGAFRLPDGSYANPRAILADQLAAAHMDPVTLSTIIDHGGEPGVLAQIAAAQADPNAKKPLPARADEAQLRGAVNAAVRPFIATTQATPDALGLDQGRLDRTTLLARHLVLSQGLAPAAAAKAAAGDLASGYQFVDTWRIPTAQAASGGVGQVRTGAGRLLGQLTANGGANLFQNTGVTAQAYADKVQSNAHWQTTPDDSGLALMLHNVNGTWSQALDRWGRPVSASWATLKAQAAGQAPSPFTTPPPDALKTPAGAPAPAASRQSAMQALSWAINRRESGFRSGLISDQGAYGQMQVLPATAAPYAQKLFGQPLDQDRLLNDAAYNRAIGNAHLADLVNHFGATPGGIALATAAYFAGQGNAEGYTDAKGYHPGFVQTIGDPRNGGVKIDAFVGRLPPKTRAYVQAVLPAAAQHLSEGG